jgi:hypothetical protein
MKKSLALIVLYDALIIFCFARIVAEPNLQSVVRTLVMFSFNNFLLGFSTLSTDRNLKLAPGPGL